MCVSVQESVEIVVFLNQIIDYLHAAHTQTHTHTQNSDCGKLGSVCRRGKKGSTQKSSQRSYAMLCEFVCLCVCVCVFVCWWVFFCACPIAGKGREHAQSMVVVGQGRTVLMGMKPGEFDLMVN